MSSSCKTGIGIDKDESQSEFDINIQIRCLYFTLHYFKTKKGLNDKENDNDNDTDRGYNPMTSFTFHQFLSDLQTLLGKFLFSMIFARHLFCLLVTLTLAFGDIYNIRINEVTPFWIRSNETHLEAFPESAVFSDDQGPGVTEVVTEVSIASDEGYFEIKKMKFPKLNFNCFSIQRCGGAAGIWGSE